MRTLLESRGIRSVAAPGFQAPTVVVSYTDQGDVKSGARFMAHGMQIANGVPLMVDEFTQSPEFSTFRLGLFGLDKLGNVERTVERLGHTLNEAEISGHNQEA